MRSKMPDDDMDWSYKICQDKKKKREGSQEKGREERTQ